MRIVTLLGLGLGSTLGLGYALAPDAGAAEPASDRAAWPDEVSEQGYVTSRACRACHPREYATWHDSYHRTMTQRASDESVLAPFDGSEVVVRGRPYRLSRRDGEFWVEMDDPDHAGGDEPRRVARRVVMTTGSHHKQVYWYPAGRGRLLGQLPINYLVQARRWASRSDAFLRPEAADRSSETGRWNTDCIKCHVTGGRPRVVARPVSGQTFALKSADSRAAEFGIACEACHGPGREHVRANRSPQRRYDQHLDADRDPTIVNPARLASRRSSDVCGRCHSVSHLHEDAQMPGWLRDGLPFRPGEELARALHLVRHERPPVDPRLRELLAADPRLLEDNFWPDGVARVSGREYTGLLDSPCYRHGDEARGVMSCVSCHRLHQSADDPRPRSDWADDQLAVGMRGDAACTQCHGGFDDGAAVFAHTHHEPDSTGSRCGNCHTPFTSYGLLKAIRSHTVTRPVVTTGTDRPNACNLCHLDRTLAWSAEHLHAWYGTPRPELGEDERRVAAGVLWTLRGDAAQRALMAWHMGWAPALEASGSTWTGPYLAQLLADPYGAVRFIAARSLRRLPGFADLDIDPWGPPEARTRAAWNAWKRGHERLRRAGVTGDAILVRADGSVMQELRARLLRDRDERVVSIAE